ncbi:U4/U6 small nuclear ribonucleoprotein PRP3, putative [Plasmodium malariae]|uniref:U4/U6 small nuclear ribonucleoprotein PRP3, putative n=1 Tax=Plasmodium malariae TaxID=5858 RepID=A0A1C3L243_PLAMA|nr:U4/U6 small nuclear ribonucleoprotein PRP3, putative [Plasmodium malariae]
MEELQKKRKSRWGDVEKKSDDKTEESNNKAINLLEDLSLNSNSHLISSASSLPSQFPNSALNFPVLSSTIHLNILKATEAAKLAIEKAKRASRFKDEAKQNVRKVEFVPKPLKFDEQGREIDEEGNVISIKPITYSTLKVNINKLEENNLLKKKNELLNKIGEEYINEDLKWFDSRIKNVQKKKKKNALNFITPGSFIKKQAHSRNFNSKTLMNFDLKKIIEEKKKVQTFQELSLNFLNDDINTNINPNLIDINNKHLPNKREWNDDEKYNIIEKWDMILFKKIENRENLKEYIDEQIDSWHDTVNREHNGKEAEEKEDKKEVENEDDKKEEKGEKYIYENEKDSSKNNSVAANLGSAIIKKNDTTTGYCNSDNYVIINKLLSKCSINILLLKNNEVIINDDLYRINMKKITNYIEHPVPLNEDKKEQITTPYMFLTPVERKKLRKRKRQEKEREKQDKIRIGLIPPPPPKMKLSNLMRVLGDNAVAHPSKMELEVRQQMKERELRHYEQNQQRKLKPEEKSKKKINKWKSNPSEENEVLVIYITNLSNKKHIFKIDINAQQLHLTGVCVMTVLYNFIIVEGKHISIERYKRLIFRRIKWNEDEGEEEEEDEDEKEKGERERNKMKETFDSADNFQNDSSNINLNQGCNCSLIWSGTVKHKNFSNWKLLIAKTEVEVTDYLKEHSALHYYHIVRKHRNVLDDI